MINLFIDTNIFLNFYHFSNEDLESLSDLSNLIEANKVEIFLTEQVLQEFSRNRESKIQDAVKRLNSNDAKAEIPQMIKDYEEANELKKAEKIFRERKKALLDKLSHDISNNSLKADKVLRDLFDKIEIIKTSDEIFNAAKRRYDIGNPPGKKGSLGDAINWESLLTTISYGEDIYFVSGDTDYISELNENDFSSFLLKEWENKKASKLHFYKSFNNFLKHKFPDVKITSEEIKEAKIEAFENSPNFDGARARLEVLHKIGEFSDQQILRIVKASISNNQIYWAHEYSPELIGEKLYDIINGKENVIPYDMYQVFCDYFDIEPILRDEDLPY